MTNKHLMRKDGIKIFNRNSGENWNESEGFICLFFNFQWSDRTYIMKT